LLLMDRTSSEAAGCFSGACGSVLGGHISMWTLGI